MVGQVLEMLQRQGRVSYRALKRQFGLDDDYIEDLKEELIYAQRLAVDEDNRVLVWTGDTGTTPAPTSTSMPLAQPEVTQEVQPIQAEPLSPEPPTAPKSMLISSTRWSEPGRRWRHAEASD